MASLDILHVLRAPVGGLFRHVLDLARGQVERGHRVGLIVDASSGGASAEAKLAELAPLLVHGISRVPMSRQIGRSDLPATAHVARRAQQTRASVVHGHGAKGGAYTRLARTSGAIRVYTAHGGSLHYQWGTPTGFFYLSLERLLMRRTDLLLFESEFGRDAFYAKIGKPSGISRVVHNGVGQEEFAPVAPAADAADLLFVGELRMLKGVDVLIQAMAALARAGQKLTANIVGAGPDRAAFEAEAAKSGLADAIHFLGAQPARDAFCRGRILVVPSRAESLPYIVLEAAAASMPLIATNVGGIPEIFGPERESLVPPGDPAALAQAINTRLRTNDASSVERLRERVRALFSVEAMTDAVLTAYAEALGPGHG